MKIRLALIGCLIVALFCLPVALQWIFANQIESANRVPPGRKEVVFWHFWGGEDRDVVDDVVRRFNASQSEHWVRAIAMPGNNLQAKLFLAVAGGDPPDLVNQDDPILADWAERGVIRSFDDVGGREAEAVGRWMFASAKRLSTYEGKLFGVCNGLDIRALYYNKTVLDQYGLAVPRTINELNTVAETIAPPGATLRERYGYLPDSRRLWAWGYVFGGTFLDERGQVTVDSPPITQALEWMQSYGNRYGPDSIAAFRQGDQSLPGEAFPLLPVDSTSLVGRYALIMDGQWRVRDIESFTRKRKSVGLPCPEFGVCPLPMPTGGREQAGWVNGNFFVMPAGAENLEGAWEFAKFWIGFHDPQQAARTCAAGGWIPVSQEVVDTDAFRDYLGESPLFNEFVKLAASPNQFPIPQVPGAAYFRRAVERAGFEAMNDPQRPVTEILKAANERIQNQLDRVGADITAHGISARNRELGE
jgi:multiple sugar transport system substrate-binding protein